MPFNIVKIAGLSSMVVAAKTFCRFANKYGATVRSFVPEDKLTIYDNGLLAVSALCALLQAVARDSITEISSP